MRHASLLILTIVLLSVTVIKPAVFAADPVTPVEDATVSIVDADTLKSKIEEVEASTDLDETTKAKLTELYRKTLTFLEKASSSRTAAESFRQARESAMLEAKTLRDQLKEAETRSPEVSLDIAKATPLAEIEQVLLKEKANRAAVEAKLGEFEKQLDYESNRPPAATKLLIEAKQRQQQLSADLKSPLQAGVSPEMAAANSWLLESESRKVRNDIKMLDEELLSQPMRIERLRALRDKTLRSLDRLGKRIQLLETLVGERRLAEAEQAKTEAEEVKRESLGKHPLVQELANNNAALSEEYTSLAAELDKISAEDEAADKEAKHIDDLFRSARQKLELAGLSEALGRVLLEQRRSLPSPGTFRKQARQREHQSTESGLRLIRYEEQRRELRNLDEYVDSLSAGLPNETAEKIRPELINLATNRRTLLEKATAINQSYLRSLGELDFAQHQLLGTIEAYNKYLDERLLWVRSISSPNLAMFKGVPGQIVELLYPPHWQGMLNTLVERLTQSPVYLLMIVFIVILRVKSRAMRDALQMAGRNIGRIRTDQYSYTLQAFSLTLLLAVPLPLLLWVTAWQLGESIDASDFTKAVAQGLMWVSPTYFYLLAFRLLCTPGGLADAHFRWPAENLQLLRRELSRLLITFLPAAFIAVVIIKYDTAIMGGGTGRVAFVLLLLTLAYFFYRVLDPRKGILHHYAIKHPKKLISRLRYVWQILVVAVPLIFTVLVILGYLYTAGTLLRSLVNTLWLVLILVVIHQLIERWLLMTRRRLAFQAAVDRREAARAALEDREDSVPGGEGVPDVYEEPEIDLIALSDASRKLLNIAMVIIGIIGFWTLWSEVLPAFGILDEIRLWHHTTTVDGVEKRLPITLADVALALLILIGAVVATRRFPAFLEIVLLRNLDMSPGGRYTIITLARYIIVGLGIIIPVGMLGGSWGQIQWLVAALGVGIGFGLQEIVANFISGLIILFERPIRVGDIVTVGNIDGVVTRIQIRATTIRNWDRKELLVPNKEFITQQLLNWSLSDQTTRLLIPVGVAYGSDVDKAMALLLETARENKHVIEDPAPYTTFDSFGDNALALTLRCYIDNLDYRIVTITELHTEINRKFNAAGIVIAFPQRDLHLDTTQPLDIRVQYDSASATGNGDKG